MSNYYISVYMPSALFQELCTECNGLYAKLHMLDCNMPNTMTIAMSFSMTTEQVGYLIYIYYPAMTLHIAVTEKKLLLYYQCFSLYLSMSVYHGMSKVSVCQHIMARAKFQYVNISWHQPKSPITVYFGSPPYQGIYQ
jgi:hypothetical protein